MILDENFKILVNIGKGGRFADTIVAAYNSSNAVKRQADFICDWECYIREV